MTDVNLKMDNLVDELIDQNVSVENLAQAINAVGIKAGPELLARLAAKLEERRIEEEAFRQPGEIGRIISRLDSVYRNELFKLQSQDKPDNARASMYLPSSWKQHVPSFGNDVVFVMKLAERALEPPFPIAFVQFVADVWGAPIRVIQEYFSAPEIQMQAEYSAKGKPMRHKQENFSEAVQKSSVPGFLKEQWLGERD